MIEHPVCPHTQSDVVCKLFTARLYQCHDCGILFSDHYRDGFDPATVYKEYYKNEVGGRFGFGVEYIVRLFRFFRAFKIFTVAPSAKKILDIGSGRGFTLFYLKKYYKYARTTGTQISKNAFYFSRDKLGLEIYDKDLLELNFEPKSFDVISMWHVLEHVHHPENYIKKIYELLDEGGKLMIEVPNFSSWSRPLTNPYWLSYDIDHHLFFFTPQTLGALLTKYGFKIKRVHTFSLEYSTFTSAQSIVSAFTKTDSVFFKKLQSGEFDNQTILHGVFIILLMPVCFLINILFYFSRRGEVLFIIAEKKT